MEDKFIRDTKEYYDFMRAIRDRQFTHLEKIREFSDCRLRLKCRVNGKSYYAVKKPDDKMYKYLGADSNKEVKAISEARYMIRSLEAIDKDLALIKDLIDHYESIAYKNIIETIPKVYRNVTLHALPADKKAEKWKTEKEAYKATFEPFHPEELIHPTIDGTMVRSKSEAEIYNYLLQAGYTFVYELPFKKNNCTFFPDFTILSEIDYETEIRLEHDGMYGDEVYRIKANNRHYKYWKNGILPGRDVYFTYDDNRGGFDIRPIIEILKSRVRPNAGLTG